MSSGTRAQSAVGTWCIVLRSKGEQSKLSSWVYDLIRSTNRVADLKGRKGLVARANAASSLCTTYWTLLLDPEFRKFIEQPGSAPDPEQETSASARFARTALHQHIGTAIALLVMAGVQGEHAADALRSVEEELERERHAVPPSIFFRVLVDAKDATCDVADCLRTEAAAEESRIRLRRLGFAAVGLALLGLTASGLALVASPAMAMSAVAAGGGGAILKVIGTTIFTSNVGRAKRDD
jgi:hypothetical protein